VIYLKKQVPFYIQDFGILSDYPGIAHAVSTVQQTAFFLKKYFFLKKFNKKCKYFKQKIYTNY